MFHVSAAVLHRLQERARPVPVLYGPAAIWGYLQPDRQTVVIVCPVSCEWGPPPTSQPTLAHLKAHHPESLPVAFTSRWAAVGFTQGSPTCSGMGERHPVHKSAPPPVVGKVCCPKLLHITSPAWKPMSYL